MTREEARAEFERRWNRIGSEIVNSAVALTEQGVPVKSWSATVAATYENLMSDFGEPSRVALRIVAGDLRALPVVKIVALSNQKQLATPGEVFDAIDDGRYL